MPCALLPSGQHLSLEAESPRSSCLQPCTCCQTRCSLSLALPPMNDLSPMETLLHCPLLCPHKEITLLRSQQPQLTADM